MTQHAQDPLDLPVIPRRDAAADLVGIPGIAAVYPEPPGLVTAAASAVRALADVEPIAASATLATERSAATPESARAVADALLAALGTSGREGIVRVRVARIAE